MPHAFWMYTVFYEFVLAGDYVCSALLSYFNNRKEDTVKKYPYTIATILLLFLLFWGQLNF